MDVTILLEQLRERAFDPERATDMGCSFFRDGAGRSVQRIARLPVSEAEIADAEAALGFRLPDLLRTVYLHVGNGGFGPGYGLIGLGGGATSDGGQSAVEMYVSLRADVPAADGTGWPEGLLPICDWGCAIRSSIDCTHPDTPVVRHDPNMERDTSAEHSLRAEHNSRTEADAQQQIAFVPRYTTVWGGAWVECPTLQEWLEAWLAGTRLFYSAYPGLGEPIDED